MMNDWTKRNTDDRIGKVLKDLAQVDEWVASIPEFKKPTEEQVLAMKRSIVREAFNNVAGELLNDARRVVASLESELTSWTIAEGRKETDAANTAALAPKEVK